MGNHIKCEFLIRQFLEEHPDILLRRLTDREVIEGKDAIAIQRLDIAKEARLCECSIGASGMRERAVNEQQGSLGRGRLPRL